MGNSLSSFYSAFLQKSLGSARGVLSLSAPLQDSGWNQSCTSSPSSRIFWKRGAHSAERNWLHIRGYCGACRSCFHAGFRWFRIDSPTWLFGRAVGSQLQHSSTTHLNGLMLSCFPTAPEQSFLVGKPENFSGCIIHRRRNICILVSHFFPLTSKGS